MLKKLLLTSLMCLPIIANAEDEPLPPPSPTPLIPIPLLSFSKAPVGSLYLTEQEKNALQNNFLDLDGFIEMYHHMDKNINYSLNLGDNKKYKLIQAIFDSIDRNETIYDALHIKYHIKYNRQCPIDFANNGSLDKNICYETFNEYLKQNQLYQSYRDKQKYTEPPILPTFWHDTPYYVPDESYLTYKQNDIIIQHFMNNMNVIYINRKICVQPNDFIKFKKDIFINKKSSTYDDDFFVYENHKIIYKNNNNKCLEYLKYFN